MHRATVGRAVARGFEFGLSLVVIAVATVGIAWARGSLSTAPKPPPLAAGALSTPAQLTASGAATFEAAVASGGTGYTFQIVQTVSLQAKAGGPKVPIPDPNNRYGNLGFTDQLQVGSNVEAGAATNAGFSMELRAGPPAGGPPDWSGATYEYGTIVKAGKTYRNDGRGWYSSSQPPGIGLDPATAALLPSLLRDATGLVDNGTTPVAGVQLRAIGATARAADVPGIIAPDASSFTRLTGPIAFDFDDLGRLAQLHVVARNTNETTFDMVVDTTIAFAYPTAAPPIPDPTPALSSTKAVVEP